MSVSSLSACPASTGELGAASTAGLGAVSVIVLAACYGEMTWKAFVKSLDGALRVTVMAFLVIFGSATFGQVLAFSGASSGLLNWAIGFQVTPLQMLYIKGEVTLEEALKLWRGAPLAEFAYEEFAQSEIRRLEGLHLHALEVLAAAMLELMTRVEDRSMLPRKLPRGAKVAHKTGWITGINHDGGIIYPAGSPPYVLVVLTRNAADTTAARTVAADIARLTWRALGPNGSLRPRWHAETAALLALHRSGGFQWRSTIAPFLIAHPQSPWRASLLAVARSRSRSGSRRPGTTTGP